MFAFNGRAKGVLVAATVVALAGCGSVAYTDTAPPQAQLGTGTTIAHASDAQVGAETNMSELNDTGDLDSLSDDDLASLDSETGTAADSSTAALRIQAKGSGQAKVTGKSSTKVGFVRSNTDGKFFLQVTKGFLWWKRETSVPVFGADSTTALKVADDLNDKVILRGLVQSDDSVFVSAIYRLPDFGIIWDLLTKGRISGMVFDSRTLVGLADSDVTVKSFSTGRLWRTKTGDDGKYSIGRLEPGEYEVSALGADFQAGTGTKTTVSKLRTATVNIGLDEESHSGSNPFPTPPAAK